jgi:hypothetical protein
MPETVLDGEARGVAPPAPDQDAVPLPRRLAGTGASVISRPKIVSVSGLPEVERPSLEVLSRVLVALKVLPGDCA